MDVSAAGSKPPLIEALRGLEQVMGRGAEARTALPGNIGNDEVATLLQLLATPSISSLLTGSAQPGAASAVNALVAAAASALSTGDTPAALAKIKDVLTIDPEQAGPLTSHSTFSSIRHEVAELVRVLSSDARVRAEERLGTAEHAIVANGPRRLPGADADLTAVYTLATQLFNNGRLADYTRAAELAQFVIAGYAAAPVSAVHSAYRAQAGVERLSVRIIAWVKKLWARAPLLVLLLGWFTLGVAGGSAAWIVRNVAEDPWDPAFISACWSIWALGFLALVTFGFYMRIRHIRR